MYKNYFLRYIIIEGSMGTKEVDRVLVEELIFCYNKLYNAIFSCSLPSNEIFAAAF